eukprot:CAMPEP_0206043620 /NCGR_PEP_ID=MMETSP1466-20131121/9567_1 /ASSEMBLY_ACC=CAM_ASM_001126 /TAXON_ID=44452 /ORGANISM="Pavlova gyrans, Strain CCMP608" /LENGTH=46 /DNA_ID= /DNA_START= /DNA_END= /DNA_ORIENTATION=
MDTISRLMVGSPIRTPSASRSHKQAATLTTSPQLHTAQSSVTGHSP